MSCLKANMQASVNVFAGRQRARRLTIFLIVVLGVSMLCQGIGIGLHGWIVQSEEIYGTRLTGLFYVLICDKVECTSHSIIKLFVRSMERAGSNEKITIGRDFCLGLLRQMIGPVIAANLCSISFYVLVQHVRKKKELTNAWFVVSSMLSVAGIIMGETIYVFLVWTDALNRSRSLADRTALGFPYTLFIYMIGFLLVFLCIMLISSLYKRDVNDLRWNGRSRQPYVPHRLGVVRPAYTLTSSI